jgi:hypothetical protein
MQAKGRFSLNWGKGASLLLLVALLVLAVLTIAAWSHPVSDSIAVEWGENFSPLRIKEPVLPPLGPVAVEWGESLSPLRTKEPVVLF